MKRLCTLLILVYILLGCKHKDAYKALAEVDSLLNCELPDSAISRLAEVQIDSGQNEMVAYYSLLLNQALYKGYYTISSDSLINNSFDYYRKSGDKKKLARTLLYRGNIRYDLRKFKEAMQDYKMAEGIAADIDDNVLRHNINFQIANVNSDNSEYLLALEYYKKALLFAYKARRDDYMTYDYQNISVSFYYQGQYDSSYFYINKSFQMVDKIPDKPIVNKAQILVSLGATQYMMNDYDNARKTLNSAISMIPLGSAYAILGRISLQEKDTTNAKDLFYEGLKHLDNKNIEIDILKSLSQIEQQQSNHKRAAELSQEAYALKDSLTRLQQAQNVKAVQVEYDWIKKSKQAASVRRWLWTGLAITILIGVVAVAVVLYRWNKTRRRLAEEQRQVEQLQAEEQQVNKELNKTKKTVERLKRARQEQDKTMSSRQREWELHGKTMERGHRLFMELNNGGSIVKWSSDDFKDFRTYYNSVDRAFAETIAQNYEPLSPNLYMLAALGHAGKNDDDIMATMGLTLKALRTTRTRLSQKRKNA